MMLRNLVTACTALLLCLPAAAAPPNIVLIISDDHGWPDYSFMGHSRVKTPHIDRLAAESLTFTRGYVPSSLCRPSLATIMTGLYPHQHGITGNDPPGEARDAANRERMTAVFRKTRNLVQMLGAAGYVSLQTGKWWEGQCRCCGFTECMTHGDVSRGGRHGDEGLKIGREGMQPVIDFLDQNAGKPFFIWYAPMLPHTPHNPPERLLKLFLTPDLAIEMARYYAMIAWLDETVGRLLDALQQRRLRENTLVIYLADNGWVQLPGRRPLFDTRAKLSPYDAGVRTPILVHWPGRIKPYRDEQTVVSSIDIAPTVLAAAGLKPERALAGIDLRNRQALARRRAVFGAIFVHTSLDLHKPAANLKYRWVVRDNFKLIAPYRPNLNLPIWEGQPHTHWGADNELYDLQADPFEKTDLAAKRPGLVATLLGELDRWWRVPSP